MPISSRCLVHRGPIRGLHNKQPLAARPHLSPNHWLKDEDSIRESDIFLTKDSVLSAFAFLYASFHDFSEQPRPDIRNSDIGEIEAADKDYDDGSWGSKEDCWSLPMSNDGRNVGHRTRDDASVEHYVRGFKDGLLAAKRSLLGEGYL